MDEPDNVIEHASLLTSPIPSIGRTLANPLGLSVDEARSGPTKQLDLSNLFPGGELRTSQPSVCPRVVVRAVWPMELGLHIRMTLLSLNGKHVLAH